MGLYPVVSPSSGEGPSKQVFAVNKPSTSKSRSRLGHPAFPIVERVLNINNLPYDSKKELETVCDSCQLANSHRLPYLNSHDISSAPLDLIFSDVWEPAPISAGRHTYYVSFIDDFSKYTWIYLLRKKNLMCFKPFKTFRNLLK